ncbi:MAG: alanine dehydrogenase [candidate division KSB1 bacterium]|jgi:alanine dehydrogenase|nr:alanine dehydrogenase [candidate division KSB1 bacterium]
MDIGIPKEISIEEKRISLTPQGVYTLVNEGHRVYIEKDAGKDGHFYDEDFQKVGGEIVYTHEEAFKRADLILKVMPPTCEECKLMSSGKTVFSFLQLALRNPECMNILVENGVTTIATELIETDMGHKPLLETMGEIAGSMLPQIAGQYLECTHGGRGITISGVPGIPPASVVIIGVGNIGIRAAEAFLGLGAQVFGLDRDIQRLCEVDRYFRKRLVTSVANPYNIERALQFGDVIIGSVYEYGKKPSMLITKEQLKLMKQGSLLMDVSIDQGGCFETSRPTTHSDPTYTKDGIIHYCVPNIPASVARIASRALNNVVLPYAREIGKTNIQDIMKSDKTLSRGLITYDGHCTNSRIADMFKLPYKQIEL